MATELPTTSILDNDIVLTLGRVNSLTLQIPGDGLPTSCPSSEPSSSISSDPPSPNPLLSESNTSSSTAASSDTTIKTSDSSEDAYTSSLNKFSTGDMLDTASTDGNETNTGMATPLSYDDSEQNTRSTASLPTSLNVRFAPLPELAPRKRRSAAPLGMAARKQLIRRRKGRAAVEEDLDGVTNSGEVQMSPSYASANVGWTEDEMEAFRKRQEALAARQAHHLAYVTAVDARIHEAEVENEEYRRSLSSRSRRKSTTSDEILSSKAEKRSKSVGSSGRKSAETVVELDVRKTVFGRIVKGASKTLFKKLSNRELAHARQQQRLANGEDEGESSADGASLGLRRQQSDSGLKLSRTLSSRLSRRTGTATPPPMPLRPILLNGNSYTPVTVQRLIIDAQPEPGAAAEEEAEEEEEGRVWEEEIGETFPLNVGQTETFVEGRAVYSRTSTVSVEGGGSSRSATPPSPALPANTTLTTTTVVAAAGKVPKSVVGKVVGQAATVKS